MPSSGVLRFKVLFQDTHGDVALCSGTDAQPEEAGAGVLTNADVPFRINRSKAETKRACDPHLRTLDCVRRLLCVAFDTCGKLSVERPGRVCGDSVVLSLALLISLLIESSKAFR